ncbi:MAG: hypothetical protein N3B12_07685, partial [Armatimonadetes bacterium]|nr:hypothetical protein [Armatimonadota bacterium]
MTATITFRFLLVITFALFGIPAHPEHSALCTTTDGRFQAIAQGPRSIAVYWKSDIATTLYVD